MTLLTSTDDPVQSYLDSLAPGSHDTIVQSLNRIAKALSNGEHTARTLPWQDLRYQHTTRLKSLLLKKVSPTTVNKDLSALKRVLQECHRLGLMSADDYTRAADIPRVRHQKVVEGRMLEPSEIRKLFEACREHPNPSMGLRHAAMLAILYGCGLRRSEVAALRLDNLDLNREKIFIHQSKGRKDREVFLPQGTIAAIKNWLTVRGDTPGPLLCRLRDPSKGITDQSIYESLIWLRQQAKLNNVTPHDLRRTFISNLFDANEDVSTIQQLAGHANSSTTIGYDRRGDQAKRKAVQNIEVPF